MITCGFLSKIRKLGNKYYEIKNILEKQNLHKVTLFFFAAKEIESHHKDPKELIPLQNQIKRMKESLYCWFTEYFYDEIMKTMTKKSLGADQVTLKRVMFC